MQKFPKTCRSRKWCSAKCRPILHAEFCLDSSRNECRIPQIFWVKLCIRNYEMTSAEFYMQNSAEISPKFCLQTSANILAEISASKNSAAFSGELCVPNFGRSFYRIMHAFVGQNFCRIMNAYFRPKSPQSSACRISADTLHAEFWPPSPQNAACRISNEIFP